MAGSLSPTQLIAASGFLKNQGLGVNSTLTSTVNSYKTLPLISAYGAMISALNGASVTLPWMPYFLSNLDATGSSITGNITTRATGLAANTQVLISNFNTASAFCNESISWNATLYQANTKSFSDYGLKISNYTDLVSAGHTNVFRGNVGQTSFSTISSILRNFGTLFSPTVGLYRIFTPTGLYLNLLAKGLVAKRTYKERDDLLLQDFKNITGSDLQKIIDQTGVVIPSGSTITTLADLLDAAKIIPLNQLGLVPGANLTGLQNALTNLGGRYQSCAEIANLLSDWAPPTLSYLNSYTSPMPSAEFSALKANIGTGHGTFSSPTVNDVIGTVAGYNHISSLGTIVSAIPTIASSTEGQALSVAVSALTSSPSNVTLKSNFVTAQTNLLSTSNVTVATLLSNCNTAIATTLTQLTTEINNCTLASISPSTANVPSHSELLSMAAQLHQVGVDVKGTETGSFLSNCATADLYGDAVRGAIYEGTHIDSTEVHGIKNMTKSDVTSVRSESGLS